MSRRRHWRFWGRRPAQDVDTELRFHFDMRVEELVAGGVTPEEARKAVLARLGDVEAVRRECIAIDHRQQRREAITVMFDSLVEDFRLVARALARQKRWALLAIGTLAIGIGATSALFAIINGTLLRPLPFPEPDRLISVVLWNANGNTSTVDEPSFATWRDQSKTFRALAAYGGASTVLRGAGDPERVRGRRATYAYFDVFGVRPLLGRTFTPDEDRRGGPQVVILSEQTWRRLYGADSSIVGRTILLDESPTTVVGVMPARFTTANSAQYWIPYRMRPPEQNSTFYTNVVGRLTEGATLEQAQAELAAISRRFNATRAERWTGFRPEAVTLHERRFGDSRPALLMLFSAVGVLLLIACANVSNLLLARSARRAREFAVRVAIGASSWRIVRLVLCESVIVSALGGLGGLAIVWASLRYVVGMGPATVAASETIVIDWQVIAFATAVSLVAGIVFGLVPALQIRRVDVNALLGSGGSRNTGSAGHARLRRALVVLELSTALVLFTAAGLLTKSFARVTAIDPGVDPNALVATVELSYGRYQGEAIRGFYERLVAAVERLPGVEAVSLVDAEPLAGARSSRSVVIDGRETPQLYMNGVDHRFFRASGARLAAGRPFTAADLTGEPVAIINETARRQLFGDRNPIGELHPIGSDFSKPARIVGIARDVLQRGVEEGAVPLVYLPLRAGDVSWYMHLVVRAKGNAQAFIPPISDIVRRLDPAQPLPTFRTIEESMSNAVAPRRFTFVLLGLFATIGGLLAAIGLYGVISYLVVERTGEIGIRLALGADAGRVMRLVLGEGLSLAVWGAMLGLAGSVASVQLLRTMLFEVSIYDPMIFVAGLIMLVITALLACALPAFRAARIDPLDAIRAE